MRVNVFLMERLGPFTGKLLVHCPATGENGESHTATLRKSKTVKKRYGSGWVFITPAMT